ncbi:MAG: alpha/beta fold hydrolase [Mucilaginibacter sp.]|nr:alpha/beta fold hydrolase [Mucilaginibacter sp.]
MKKSLYLLALIILVAASYNAAAQSKNDTLVLRNDEWGKMYRSGFRELNIPSSGSLMQGFMYTPNGGGKHPLLIMLHGFPGNERNLDLAQLARARGWNVLYFDYRGSWGSQGKFSFKNCVEDVVNVVAYCKKNAAYFNTDTTNITLFGHSMGGWICLKALTYLPEVKKGFALSTWDIYADVKQLGGDMAKLEKANGKYFVLNATTRELFQPVIDDPDYFNLRVIAPRLAGKQVVMLDEHHLNKGVADAITAANKVSFDYQVWATDHGFSNTRVSMMKKVLAFIGPR